MGFVKWLVIIVVVIFIIYLVFPDTYFKGRDAVVNFTKNVFGSSKTDDSSLINSSNGVAPPSNSDTLNNYIDEGQVVDFDFDESDPCNWDFQAAPRSQGGSCMLTFDDPHLHCLENPPVSYTGVIDLVNRDSYPLLRCCEDNGLCAWR